MRKSSLSVIIPTVLKDTLLLCRAIDSVLLSNNIEVEVIVVNDNPTIDITSIAALGRYITKNITFINNEGKSRAAGARNFGVKKATTDLITFLDDDDFILPGRLESMLASFNEQQVNNVVLISTGRLYEYNNFQKVEVVKKQLFGILKLSDINVHNQIDIGFVVKKELFESLKGFDTSFTNLEDWDFIIRCLEYGDAYKVESYSYIVKNDVDPNRVSHNDHLGLRELADKHKAKFGKQWFYKIKTQELRSLKKLSFFKACALCIKTNSFYPMKNYLATLRN